MSTHSTLSHTSARPTRRSRHGRVLVECLVATVLLTIAALALTEATRAVATLTEDATLVARAQLQAGAAAERGLLQPCDTATTRTTVDGVRVRSELLDAGTAALETRVVSTVMQHSPFAHRRAVRDSQRLALSTARTCP